MSYNSQHTDPTLTIMVTPTEYSGKDISPFNTFSLSCTATKPENIVPSLQLNWYHNGVQMDDSVSGVTIQEEEVNGGVEKSSELTVTSASVLSSGMYTCSAIVSIPDSTPVMSNQTATVTITGIICIP